jgi:hypothetical protein
MSLPFTPRQRQPEDKIPYLPDTIVIGGFRINTTATGALETKPVGAPPSQDAADLVQPASLRLGESTITLEASAEFGGSIVLKELLNKLLDIPIFSIEGVEMPIRSLFGSLLSRVAVAESVTADLSGVRIPAVLNEVVNNASLDAARELAQQLKDSSQDASGVLIALAAASAASDITGLSTRVTALEAIPPADLSSVEGRLTTAETAIIAKADQAAVDSALAAKAAAADLSALDTRVGSAEGSITSAASRLDAVEGALPGKVSQGDYDVYVAANDAAVGAAAAAAATAQTAADAAAAVAAAAEVKGLVSKMTVEDLSTVGVNAAYWIDGLGATLATAMDAGKLMSYNFDAPATEVVLPAGSPAAGAVRRLRNAHASAVLPISLESVSYEIVAGETMVWQHNGSAWRLL